MTDEHRWTPAQEQLIAIALKESAMSCDFDTDAACPRCLQGRSHCSSSDVVAVTLVQRGGNESSWLDTLGWCGLHVPVDAIALGDLSEPDQSL